MSFVVTFFPYSADEYSVAAINPPHFLHMYFVGVTGLVFSVFAPLLAILLVQKKPMYQLQVIKSLAYNLMKPFYREL